MSVDEEMLLEQKLTLEFTADKARLSTSFGMPVHHNLVLRVPEQLRDKLAIILKELKEYPELHISELANCHMTLLIINDATKPEDISTTAATALKEQPLSLQVSGIHIRAPGVFLNVYSEDKSLWHTRQAVARATDTTFDPTDRLANVGWITLARFTKPPTEKLIKYVRSNVDREFGSITNAKPTLHHSNSSIKLGPIIWEYS